MAAFARLTGGVWRSGDDSTRQARVGQGGWYVIDGASSPPADDMAPQPLGELSHAWRMDPGFGAIWGPMQYGIPEANRDSVYITMSTGAVTYVRPRIIAGTIASRSTGAAVYVKPQAVAVTGNALVGETGAVVYVRPRTIAGTAVSMRSSSAAAYIALRTLSGLLTSTTVEPEEDLTNLRKLFPRQSQKVVMPDGSMAIEWYRFFDYLVNTFLGGPDAPTMGDVIAEIERQIAAARLLEARTLAIAQQAQANAESLSAAVQVIQNNALTGAAQIPPPQTTMES